MKLSIDKLLQLLPDFKVDRRGKNLIGNCPFCNHDEFGISIEEGHKYGCYRKSKCGQSGNIFTLLKFLGKYDTIISERNSKLSGRIEFQKFSIQDLDLESPLISNPLGWKRVYEIDYLNKRGFEIEDYNRYEVGVTSLHPKLKNKYVIFLVKENNIVKGWVGRHIWGKNDIEQFNKSYFIQTGIKNQIKRYRNSISDFSKLIYGIDEIIVNVIDTIIVVEGIFDKINIDRLLNLYNSNFVKCNATFKCNVSDEQIAKWQQKGIKNLILLYDSDVIKQIRSNVERLQKYFNVTIGYTPLGKDPGDMDSEDVERVLNNLQDPTEFRINKLEVPRLKF